MTFEGSFQPNILYDSMISISSSTAGKAWRLSSFLWNTLGLCLVAKKEVSRIRALGMIMKKDGKPSRFNALILLSPALFGGILQIVVQSHELKIYILRSIVAFHLEGSSGGLWCNFLLKAEAAMRSD